MLPPGQLPAFTAPSVGCEINKLNFAGRLQTSFTDFFLIVKNHMTKLSHYEIKSIYRFLDSKTLGFFSNARWSNFYSLFVMPFLNCDADNDCLLNKDELKKCLEGDDMQVLKNYMSAEFDEDIMVTEIIFSLDYLERGGINLNNYLLFKKIVIGFRQYHVEGFLDKETFFSAIKTTFVDKLVDELDSEIAFRLALSLMFEKIINLQLNFMQYFEICRLCNNFFSYGVPLGVGFIKKEEVIRNYEGDRYPTKLNYRMYEEYFSLYKDDLKLNIDYENSTTDPNSLRFEDYATLEFWANIFMNYTDPMERTPSLNATAFKTLFEENKYVRKKYWIYISYSNFEDYEKIKTSQYNPSNITDFDFLTSFQYTFLETSTNTYLQNRISKNSMKINLRVNKNQINSRSNFVKSSVFGKFENKMQMNTGMKSNSKLTSSSIFNLNLEDDQTAGKEDSESNSQKNIQELLDAALKNYFTVVDLDFNKFITFEEFIVFIKYLRLYDRLNKGNDDKRGILKGSSVNYINQFNIYPKLTVTEKIRIQNLDSINCNFIDLLIFLDYMVGPICYNNYFAEHNKNFIDELHALIMLKKLNLYADINQRNMENTSGPLLNKFNFDSILALGLMNKCSSNARLFNITANLTDINITQILNSTLVDPNNVPNFDNNSTAPGLLNDTNKNSTMSGDNVVLDNKNGGGMDKSENMTGGIDSF